MSNLLNIKDEQGNWIPIPVITNGIASITQNANYTLTITLEDGTTYTTTSIRGEKGDKGDTGNQGIQGEKGDKGDAFEYSDFTPEQLASLKGEKGDKGDTGEVSYEELYSHLFTSTASGTIASFKDGADNIPMKDVKVQIEPVQNLNGQVSPYPPGGGKNLFDESLFEDAAGTVKYFALNVGDGTYTLSTTCPVNSDNAANLFLIAGNVNSGASTNTNGVWDRHSVTTTAIDGYVTIAYRKTATTNPNDYDTQLELGSTATAWSPYENICLISGWTGANVQRTGKNLFDADTIMPNLRFEQQSDGSWYADKAFAVGFKTVWENVNGINGAISLTYTYKYNSSSNQGVRFIFVYSDGTSTDNYANASETYITKTFTSNAGKTLSYIKSTYGSGAISTWIKDVQLELGSTATEYEPYQGETYSITFSSEAGTVYSGTLDVTTGELVVDKASVDLGTLTWAYASANSLFNSSLPLGKLGNNTKGYWAVCSNYQANYNASFAGWGAFPDKTVSAGCQYDSSTYKNLVIKDTAYTDAATFATAMNGVQLVYELATPVTYNLTPTEITSLFGINNIWADTGDITAVYRADAKLYIDSIDFPVDDIQVNGTSIVENGIANVPIADNSTLGVMKPSSGLYVGSTGALYTNKATSASIKTGTNNYLPIVPNNQHEASFYGLAKAAGDTTQSASDNEVGQYTDTAKTAINRMLGIKYDPDSLAVIDVATGNVASFKDGADNVPFKDIKVNIDPVQDLHGYDSPWVGGGGKNLLNPDNVFGASAYYTINSDGSITVLKSNGTAWDNGTNFPISLEAGTYTVSRSVVDGALTIRKASDNYGEDICRLGPNATSGSFTLDSNDVIRIKFNSGSAVTYPSTSFFQLEKGETATAWSPYSNICPITGWTGAKVIRTGKNLLNDDRSAYQKETVYLRLKNVIPDGVEARFTFSNKDTSIDTSGCYIGFFYTETVNNGYRWVIENGVIKQNTSNVANTGYYTGEYCSNVMIYPNTDECFNKLFSRYNIMVELGSTATEYEPYQGETYDITFPTEAGTVYGGTLDVTNGILTVDRKRVVFDGTNATWEMYTVNGVIRMQTRVYDMVSVGGITYNGEYIVIGNIGKTQIPDAIGTVRNYQNRLWYYPPVGIDTVESFNAWLAENNLEVVYLIEEPVTYQLTPTEIDSLLGTNNLWADTGDSTVEYRANTKLYISKKITEAVSALT